MGARLATAAISTWATLATACASDGPVALDELPDPSLFVLWYQSALGEELESPRFYVQLAPRHDEDECPRLSPEVLATVGTHDRADESSVELSVISLGGWRTTDGRRTCTVPTFELPGELVTIHPLEPTTPIEIHDGETTLGLVAEGLFVERTAALPTTDALVIGEPTTVRWEPASDLLGLVAVYFHPDDPPEAKPAFVRSGAELSLEPGGITFTVPEVEPGPGTLRVDASVEVPTSACRGLVRCRVEVLGLRRTLPTTLR